MKNILLFTIFILGISCKNTTNTEEKNTIAAEPETINNIDWLLGSWERIGEEEGKITHEHWSKINDKTYKGLGCTMLGKDTVWQENMLLIHKNNTWALEVSGTDSDQATIFEFTELTKHSFTCENEKNEFPKKIEYYKDKDQLKAKISGGGPEIPFQFKKIK